MSWARKERIPLGGQRVRRMLGDENGMPRDIAKVLQRARTMPRADAVEWADVALASVGRSLADHQRHPHTGDFLRQALDDAATLYGCLQAAVERLPPPPLGAPLPGAELGVAAVRQG